MKPNESLGHAFGQVSRLLDRELREALAEYHVLPAQLPVLLALFRTDGLAQTELAELAGVEQPTMATTLNRMEQSGLVRRDPDRHDARRVGVLLTAPARRLEKPLADTVTSLNRRALRGLSAEERSLIYELPDRLRANLRR